MRKPLFSVFFIAFMVCGLTFEVGSYSGIVHAATEVTGIITSDTTWSKANSPYNLTGNIAIDKGVTLIIEPGVTVNLNSYYIRVNGTLTARGSSTDNIYFNGGSVVFTPLSTGWNEQTGTGSIIENAIINATLQLGNTSPMVNKNTIMKTINVGGGSPIISKNTIDIGTLSDWLDRPVYLSTAIGIGNENTALIIDNTISGSLDNTAISVSSGSPTIQRNRISNSYGYGGDPGYWQSGISISGNSSPIIKQNTITKNAVGISLEGSPTPTIVNNNIEDNSNYNLRMMLGVEVDIAAANNWWGTTDTSVIDDKIYDYEDDFNLGKVSYTPILNTPNPQAMPDPNAPIPTPLPEQTPTHSPTPPPPDSPSTSPTPSPEPKQMELIATVVGITIVAVVVGAGLGLFIYLIKRK
jgi:parallel beta-helix repeat protein